MANSDAVYYAIEFVKRCKELCELKLATLIIIAGTESHDCGQIRIFSEPDNANIDIRIVENAQFIYAQGLKILCLPEEYNK